jgi:hypothetical protein
LPLYDAGLITTAVFTKICGGQHELGATITALIHYWQEKPIISVS